MPAGSPAQLLPITLPLLLATPAWQHSSAAVALLLQRLTAALQHLAAMRLQSPGSAPNTHWQQLLRRCLLAVRHIMPAEGWPVLASLL